LPVESHSVLVLGSGLAGLLHIKLARAMGASRIVAVDTNASRLEAARHAGADEALLAPCDPPHADRVFVCTGSPNACESALESVNRGGRILYFATGGPEMKVPVNLTRFWLSQPSIVFTYGASPRDMREAIELIRTGKVKVDDLITHSFGIEQIAEAFSLVANPRGGSLKILIAPNREHATREASYQPMVSRWLPVPVLAFRRPWAMRGVWKKALEQAIQKLTGYASLVVLS